MRVLRRNHGLADREPDGERLGVRVDGKAVVLDSVRRLSRDEHVVGHGYNDDEVAQSGEAHAFGKIVEPKRGEVHTNCLVWRRRLTSSWHAVSRRGSPVDKGVACSVATRDRPLRRMGALAQRSGVRWNVTLQAKALSWLHARRGASSSSLVRRTSGLVSPLATNHSCSTVWGPTEAVPRSSGRAPVALR